MKTRLFSIILLLCLVGCGASEKVETQGIPTLGVLKNVVKEIHSKSSSELFMKHLSIRNQKINNIEYQEPLQKMLKSQKGKEINNLELIPYEEYNHLEGIPEDIHHFYSRPEWSEIPTHICLLSVGDGSFRYVFGVRKIDDQYFFVIKLK